MQACFTQALAGLASWVCSNTSTKGRSKESLFIDREPSTSILLDPTAELRRAELFIEDHLPVSQRYKLGGALGLGGYGQVIAAKCKRTQRSCAVKSVPIGIFEQEC